MEALKRPLVIVALVLVVLAGAIGVGRLIASEPVDGYGAELETSVVAACTRALGADDDSERRCDCVYDKLAASLTFDRLVDEAEKTADSGNPTEPFVAAAAACGKA